ncbi:hypothetical protein GcM3_193024b [Golovinomyces cichoracearum]|uniref:Uncharacterized protein n=1 Tax=Golovinomyces cichoracearum TaxID=62708 RepID=A0A420HH63_9PEZI|nr:hypothetical protein GcM3_193024b [Golovinomyces cichoracearum]
MTSQIEETCLLSKEYELPVIGHKENYVNDTTYFDCPFPLPPPETFEKNRNQASKEEIQYFQLLIGSTNYAATSTRPDISNRTYAESNSKSNITC